MKSKSQQPYSLVATLLGSSRTRPPQQQEYQLQIRPMLAASHFRTSKVCPKPFTGSYPHSVSGPISSQPTPYARPSTCKGLHSPWVQTWCSLLHPLFWVPQGIHRARLVGLSCSESKSTKSPNHKKLPHVSCSRTCANHKPCHWLGSCPSHWPPSTHLPTLLAGVVAYNLPAWIPEQRSSPPTWCVLWPTSPPQETEDR